MSAAMEDASTSSLTIKDQSQENEDEDSLVINTSSDAQKRQGGAKVSSLCAGVHFEGGMWLGDRDKAFVHHLMGSF